MATKLTYLPHLKTDAELKAEERQAKYQQKLRDAAPELLEAAEQALQVFIDQGWDDDLKAAKALQSAIAKTKP